jgi:N-acetylneuraminic acid mutarotase
MKMKLWLLMLLVFFFTVFSFYVLASEKWIQIGTIPLNGRVNFKAIELNGKIYLLGGVSSEKGTTNLVDVYNPKNNAWMPVNPMKEKKTNFAASAYQGKIYVIGGYREDGRFFMNTVEIYNPENNTWSKGKPLPSRRGWMESAVSNDKIYVIGGRTVDFHNTNAVEIYDPVQNEWSLGPTMKESLYNFGIASFGDKIFIFGGVDESGKILDTLYILNTRINSWSKGTHLPTPRENCQALLVGEKVYIIGGYNDDVGHLASVDVYDIESETWDSLSPMNTPRWGFGAATVDGTIFVFGGGQDFGERSTFVKTYEKLLVGELKPPQIDDFLPLSIEIVAPLSGTVVSSSKIILVADLKGNLERVYLNGKRVLKQDIRWLADGVYQLRVELPLNRGKNIISIEAYDPEENSVRQDIEILRK